MKHIIIIYILILNSTFLNGQNVLKIPSVLQGTTFNLEVQKGTQVFFGNTSTPTYGINGSLLGPTLLFQAGDIVTLNVKNSLPVPTTMHWHGLHVAPENDGGPHQIIDPGTVWSPSFKIRNNAGTYWYHPHGAGQTDPQVSKGLAGMIIIQDSNESKLNLPRTYGIDDIPVIIQTKAFDEFNQIAIASSMDTTLMVNGTINPYYKVPAQVIRFRILNGSSMRSYMLGISNNQSFYQMSSDGGLLDSSVMLNRLRISPGERADILLDLSGKVGQTIEIVNYGTELSNGIYGADSVGDSTYSIHDYYDNQLNGKNYTILELRIDSAKTGGVFSVPQSLVPVKVFNIADATNKRTIVFDTLRALPADVPNLAEGPFGMNNRAFDMDSINEIIYINTTEVWTLINKTMVAHPFHIHDIQFNIIENHGVKPEKNESGWKDVVLVMPNDSVKFITKFETFANNMIPYMYHCHLLHHEDDGMMGSFLVIDTIANGIQETQIHDFKIFPNPVHDFIQIELLNSNISIQDIHIVDIMGKTVHVWKNISSNDLKHLDISNLNQGQYMIQFISNHNIFNYKLIKL